ncbi:MAG: hypothetical protein L6R35_004055, partial [Caloplaca aegaea]
MDTAESVKVFTRMTNALPGVVFTDLDLSPDLLSDDNTDGDFTQSPSDSARNLTESLSKNDHEDDPSPDDEGDNLSQDDGGNGLAQHNIDKGNSSVYEGSHNVCVGESFAQIVEDLQIAGSARTASV